jgi:hypothetical protein
MKIAHKVAAGSIIIALITSITLYIFDMKLSRGWAELISALSNSALAIIAGIAAMLTLLALWSGNEKERYLKLDLSAATEGAAEANKIAAIATQKAAEANLEIERMKTPRTLDAKQKTRIAQKLAKYAGQQFDLACVHGDPEPYKLMGQIEDALLQAGWIAIDWTGSALGLKRAGKTVAGSVQCKTVVVHLSSPDKKTPPPSGLLEKATLLKNALNDEGIDAVIEYGPHSNTSTDAIHVVVGVK